MDEKKWDSELLVWLARLTCRISLCQCKSRGKKTFGVFETPEVFLIGNEAFLMSFAV
jgi:hypothetical protein